jgi:very-short-patch-repair endonuclease
MTSHIRVHGCKKSFFELRKEVYAAEYQSIFQLWREGNHWFEIVEKCEHFDFVDVYRIIRKNFDKNEIRKRSINHIKATNLKKYGVENVFQTSWAKEKIELTCLERYGTKHPQSSSVVRDKYVNTMIARYGTRAPLQNEIIKLKTIDTNLARYGANWFISTLDQSLLNRVTMLAGTHPWYRKTPWGVENIANELFFDQECRKRGLDPLDESQGWEVPRVVYFEGDCFRFESICKPGLRPDRLNRRYRIWIEIDDDGHLKTQEYDFTRDEFCRKHKWNVVRIYWKRLYENEVMNYIVNKIYSLMNSKENYDKARLVF